LEVDITALHGFANLISSIFLEEYLEEHPEVTVLDPPNAIEHLNNRQSMLEEVADLNLSNFYGNIEISMVISHTGLEGMMLFI